MAGYIKGALAGAALLIGTAATADAALLQITPTGNAADVIVTSGAGNNKNDVLGGGFTIQNNAVLTTTTNNVVLTFYYWGAESGYFNKLTTAFGNFTETGGSASNKVVNPFPGVLVAALGGIQAAAGVVKTDFSSGGYVGTIGNGTPTSTGSVAFAYLTNLTSFEISMTPTNYVLFALDDGGAGPDDNHDDYVGVIVATPIPAALPLFLTALAGTGLLARRNRKEA